jgi:hypothetical protein
MRVLSKKAWRCDLGRFSEVRRVWERNRCVAPASISLYSYWICRFSDYCRIEHLDQHDELTRSGARRFSSSWSPEGSPCRGRLSYTLNSSRSTLRAWSLALGILGVKVPSRESPTLQPPPLSATMAAFAAYLKQVRGNPTQTIHKKLAHMALFTAHCRKRHCAVNRVPLQDIDEFIVACRTRYARTAVSDICSTVCGFQRFFCTTGRSRRDLSAAIIGPIMRVNESPHRPLPSKDIGHVRLDGRTMRFCS